MGFFDRFKPKRRPKQAPDRRLVARLTHAVGSLLVCAILCAAAVVAPAPAFSASPTATTVRAAAQDTLTGYAPGTAEFVPTAAVQPPTITLEVPVVTGEARVGQPLTSTEPLAFENALGSPLHVALAYQWLRAGRPIAGATDGTYVPVAADLGHALSVRVTAGRPGYRPATQTSASTGVVRVGAMISPTPLVNGVRKVGATLTAVPGAWTKGATLKYQWLRSGAPITGATAARYTLTAADLGKIIKVRVVGSHPGYATVAKDSLPAAPVTAGALNAPAPRIGGTPKVGSTLTATPGTWTVDTTLRYQWYRSGTPIAGATAATYRLTAIDRNHTIKVRVVGSKPGYTPAIRHSVAAARVT
jgi:hypothetical protein